MSASSSRSVDRPAIPPRERLIANFNVDGLAVWGRTNDVEFIGHGKNSLTALAAAVEPSF